MMKSKILMIVLGAKMVFLLSVYANSTFAIATDRAKVRADYKFSKISYAELKKLELLDNDEMIDDESKTFGRIAEGLKGDLDGDGRDEIIIAGLRRTHEMEESDGLNVRGYIKIVKPAKEGKYQILSKKDFDSSRNYIVDMEIHNMDRSGTPKILVTFSSLGSTYYWTDNIIVYYSKQQFHYFSKEAPGGPIEIRDLDRDGIEELIDHQYHDSGAPGPDKVFWYDIYEWTGNGLKKVNERYPSFYEKQISTYYDKIIKQEQSDLSGDPDKDYYTLQIIKVTQELIERAKKIISRSKNR